METRIRPFSPVGEKVAEARMRGGGRFGLDSLFKLEHYTPQPNPLPFEGRGNIRIAHQRPLAVQSTQQNFVIYPDSVLCVTNLQSDRRLGGSPVDFDDAVVFFMIRRW